MTWTAEDGRKGTSPACGGAKSPLTGPGCTPGGQLVPFIYHVHSSGYGVRVHASATPRILKIYFLSSLACQGGVPPPRVVPEMEEGRQKRWVSERTRAQISQSAALSARTAHRPAQHPLTVHCTRGWSAGARTCVRVDPASIHHFFPSGTRIHLHPGVPAHLGGAYLSWWCSVAPALLLIANQLLLMMLMMTGCSTKGATAPLTLLRSIRCWCWWCRSPGVLLEIND